MRTIQIIYVIALLGAMMVTPAAATTWYVDDDGGYDFTTIGGALNAASDGDTIFVYNGTYGADSIYIEKPNLTVIGEGADVVTWVAPTSSQFIHIGTSTYSASGSILDGLTVVNSEKGIEVTANSPNCIIRNCVFDGMTAGEACQLKGDNITFENNVILNPACEYAALCVLGDYCTIINNTIEGNTGAGISLELDYPKNNVVTKNNLISNAYAGIELYMAGSGNKIYLNNFVDNGVPVTTSGSTAPAVTYWNSTEPITYTHGGAIHTNYLGNYWSSDYTGSDGDGDGLGAPPYAVPEGLGEDHRPLMVPFENYPAPTGAADPDLTPTSIATDSLSAGVPAAITVDVSNIGSADAGSFNVTLKVEETVIGSDTVASLGAGSSVPVVFTWTPDAAGTFNLTAIADSDDAVAESDEANNGLTNEVTVTPAAATTWYVHEGESIWDTINSANDGDTVFVYNGTYGVFAINTPNITLTGEGVDVVTVDCGGSWCAIGNEVPQHGSGSIVDGFRFVNSGKGIVVNSGSPDCIIRNCVFDGVGGGGNYGPQLGAENTTFMDNVISNATAKYAALDVGKASLIVNNTIRGSTQAAGISLDGASAINCIVTKNNLISNAYAGIELYNAGSGNKIYLNNFVDNGKTVTTSGKPAPAVTYWNSTEPIEYTYNGNTYTNYIGNYWGSDYTGGDSDGDGIGDTPYLVPEGLGEDYRPLMEPFENYVSEEEPAPTPPTSFLISGNVTYTSGSHVLDPAVTVTNLATGEHFTVKTDAGSNYYLTLTDSTHITAGDTIRINASDGSASSETDHPVTASEIETGGFVQDMLLEAGDRPDLTVTEKSEDWISLKDRTYNVTYTVENIGGDGAGASTTSIKIDGTVVATDSVPALAIGENYTSTLGPFTLSGENDTIRVCADSGEIINELNETNNCLENVLEAPSMPDLIVWVALKTPGYVNEDNILGVRVKNAGTGDAGSFNVSLSIDGTPMPEQTVPSLLAGETTELEYAWTPTELGGHLLSATADTNDEVLESNETNNDLARTSVIIKPTDWAQFHHDIVHTGFSPCSAPDTNETLWISDEISAIGGTSTVVADGKVFAYSGPTGWSSGDGALYCLDEFTGAILWNISIPTPASGSWSSPAYHNGRVFTSTNTEAGCYNATTGEQIWVFENPTGEASCNGGPVVADGKVIVNDWQAGHFYCLDEETGELLWTFTETKTGNWGVGYAQGVPAYEDGKFYLTTWIYVGGTVYCVDADTGEEIWNQTTPLDTCGSPAVVDGTVYVTNYKFDGDGAIYAINASDGEIMWHQTIQRSDSTPAVAYGNVYVTGGCLGYSDRQTYCFNATTGDLVWETDTADTIGGWTCSVAVADGKVFVGTEGGASFDYAGTYALDAFTGDVIWSYPEGGSSPAIADNIVFTIGGGKVYAFYTLPAAVQIKPETLNLNDDDDDVFTAFVTLPEGYDVADINVGTVECEGAPALSATISATNTGTFVVKFARAGLVDVSVGDAVEMSVTGELADGTGFHGSDLVRVIAESDEVEKKRKSK